MTAQQQGGEPVWCVRHPDGYVRRHLSQPVRVGVQRDRGQVTALLVKAGHGPTWVTVTAAHMASATVDLSLEDAVALRDGLTDLLRQAGAEL